MGKNVKLLPALTKNFGRCCCCGGFIFDKPQRDYATHRGAAGKSRGAERDRGENEN